MGIPIRVMRTHFSSLGFQKSAPIVKFLEGLFKSSMVSGSLYGTNDTPDLFSTRLKLIGLDFEFAPLSSGHGWHLSCNLR